MNTDALEFSPEVAEALSSGRPVVALESTIITHGMPHPENLATAKAVEAVVRAHGAVPATIAILGGRIKVGLSPNELERLAVAKGVIKTSRRDLALVVAGGLDGATTVAGTLIVAEMAGIRVFVTGGIGGVHRGAASTMDVSADLTELARANVAVVCAGAKSILDLGLTLEYLETQGVPVLGLGTNRFPAFYTRDSGFEVAHRVESPQEAAAVLAAQRRLGLSGGCVIANPIPEADALPPAEIDQHIARALADAEKTGVTGKAVTPYLLARLGELTAGRSLKANIALIRHNAAVGAAVAVALAAAEH